MNSVVVVMMVVDVVVVMMGGKARADESDPPHDAATPDRPTNKALIPTRPQRRICQA